MKFKNIIKAIDLAQADAKTIGFSGFDGGLLKKKAKVNLHVPINDMQISEDFHVIAMHIMYDVFIRYLMENKIIWYLNPWDALPNESGFDRSINIIKKII